MKRCIIIVLDAVGIGELPDAYLYGDQGSNTLMNVKKAEDMLEVKRVALNELMKERKTHEKLRDKKFEDFQKEEKDNESKEIDQLVSFTYNS